MSVTVPGTQGSTTCVLGAAKVGWGFQVCPEDVSVRGYIYIIISKNTVKLVSFLRSVHWPAQVSWRGSYVELLVLNEIWAGERLILETAVFQVS